MSLKQYIMCLLIVSGNALAMQDIIVDLRDSVQYGDEERVDQILKENPSLDLPDYILDELFVPGGQSDLINLQAIIAYAKRRDTNGHLLLINYVNPHGNTLLSRAVWAGNAAIVEILLQNGADTQIQYPHIPQGLLGIAIDNIGRNHVREYAQYVLDQQDVMRIIALLQQHAPQLVNAQKPTVQRQLAQQFYWGRDEAVPNRRALPDAFKPLVVTEQSPLPHNKSMYIYTGAFCVFVLACIGVYKYWHAQNADEEEADDEDDEKQDQDAKTTLVEGKK